MTYIKQIELENFKSFAGHTKFDFTKGFNAIAGANGSGKSNIIDATMFVLGGTSKKEMRSELLTDLIFNGGKNGKPAEFAKVTVVMDNSDKSFSNFEDKEISISRKVDRNGKSVYRVNGRASTREEILNILSIVKVKQDSFNIVPQGKILEVIGYSAEDRLRIINDISGISVFEDKKSKAMNEMKKVESNISKIDTILNEKKKLMEQLEKERTKAIEFKELKGRQENLLAKQILIRRNSIAGDLEVIQGKIGSIDGDNKKLSEELGELNLKITSNRKEIDRINTHICEFFADFCRCELLHFAAQHSAALVIVVHLPYLFGVGFEHHIGVEGEIYVGVCTVFALLFHRVPSAGECIFHKFPPDSLIIVA